MKVNCLVEANSKVALSGSEANLGNCRDADINDARPELIKNQRVIPVIVVYLHDGPLWISSYSILLAKWGREALRYRICLT
jgi:hypothetical protein